MRQKKPRDTSKKAIRILLISGAVVLLISGLVLSFLLVKAPNNAASTRGEPSNGSTPTDISIQGHSNTPVSTGTPASKPTATPPIRSKGKTYYVSKNGSNRSGTSWLAAWNELDRIPWPVIQPGDTILLDGGQTGMTYTTTLSIRKSGTPTAPITIERASDAGHNGTVNLFGGSTVALPYCGQKSWTPPPRALGFAIQMNGNSWIAINGISWNGIQVHGYNYLAISFQGGESNDSMSNLEVYNNGNAFQSGGSWWGEFPGIALGTGMVTNLTFNHMNVHDNGEDNFQGSGTVRGLTVQNSWLHYTRTVPGVPSESYNLCTHNDGLQIFGTNPGSNITFQHDILGPGLTNGLIFQPEVDNVTLKDSLIIDPGSNVTVENSGNAKNWIIDHVTAIGESDNLTLEGSGNRVTNSIFYDGHLLLNGSVSYSSNNCLWHTDGSTIQGRTADPEFVTDLSSYPVETTDITRYPAISFLENANFSLRPGSPCSGSGSSLASASQLI